jgi:low affinity Fe/Cu permease
VKEAFRRFAHAAARVTGTMYAFLAALVVVLVWAAMGPVFNFSDTWQLVINTSTTIVTFLMVFLIQNTQNRDSQALHAKIDELVIHLSGADNKLVGAEDLSDEDLQRLKEHYVNLARTFERASTSRADASG